MVMKENVVSTIIFQANIKHFFVPCGPGEQEEEVQTFSSIDEFLKSFGLSGSWDNIDVYVGESWVIGSDFMASPSPPASKKATRVK